MIRLYDLAFAAMEARTAYLRASSAADDARRVMLLYRASGRAEDALLEALGGMRAVPFDRVFVVQHIGRAPLVVERRAGSGLSVRLAVAVDGSVVPCSEPCPSAAEPVFAS